MGTATAVQRHGRFARKANLVRNPEKEARKSAAISEREAKKWVESGTC